MKEKLYIRKGEGNGFGTIDGNIAFTRKDGRLFVEGEPGEASMENAIKRVCELNEFPFDYRFASEDKHCPGHIEADIYGSEHAVANSFDQPYHPNLVKVYQDADFHLIKGEDKHVIGLSISTSRQFAAFITELRTRGIKTVVLTGWAYAHCLGLAAIDLKLQGFDVYVVRDATRSVAIPATKGMSDWMKRVLKEFEVKEITFDQIEAITD